MLLQALDVPNFEELKALVAYLDGKITQGDALDRQEDQSKD